MATPLFWDTCLMVNAIYSKLSGYPVPFQIDPMTKHSTLDLFYSYVFTLASLTVFGIDVVHEGLLIGSLKVPLILCVIYLDKYYIQLFFPSVVKKTYLKKYLPTKCFHLKLIIVLFSEFLSILDDRRIEV